MAHRAAVDRWESQRLREGWGPADVLAGLSVSDALRAVSYLTLAMGTNATIASGRHIVGDFPFPAGSPHGTGPLAGMRRVLHVLSTHFSPGSSVFQASLRTGFGLALAVWVARILKLENGFWVVLGTLSVLRLNALATGRTTIEAVTGAVIGFAVAGLFTAVVSTNPAALWAALPVAVLVAAFSSSAIGFMAGQAGFTIFVIIVFNLLTPVGWRLGLARVEDVIIGTAISLVVGLLLWPRGARRSLSTEVGRLYRDLAGYLDESFRRILRGQPSSTPDAARRKATQARDRAGEALDRYLAKRGAKPLEAESASHLVSSGSDAILAGDLINTVADMGYAATSCEAGVVQLESQLNALLEELRYLSGQLVRDEHGGGDPSHVSAEALKAAEITCLAHWREDSDGGEAAVAVVAAGEWLDQLGEEVVSLEGPVESAAAAAALPWWR